MARCMKRKRRSRCQLVAPMLVTGFTTGFRREQMRGLFTLLFMLVFGAAPVQAQTDVCRGDPPTAGQQIECTEGVTSIDAIDINLQSGVNIETTAADADGILGDHGGTGAITIDVTGVSGADTITTRGESADGIYGGSYGKGSVDITVSDVVITTMATDSANPGARGVAGEQIFLSSNLVPDDGVFYNVNINVSGSRISTMGSYGYGIYGLLGGEQTL